MSDNIILSVHNAGTVAAKARDYEPSPHHGAFATVDLTTEDGTIIRLFMKDIKYAARLTDAVNGAGADIIDALSVLVAAVEPVLPSAMIDGEVSGDERDCWKAWEAARAALKKAGA